jgi:hypothetical protein
MEKPPSEERQRQFAGEQTQVTRINTYKQQPRARATRSTLLVQGFHLQSFVVFSVADYY